MWSEKGSLRKSQRCRGCERTSMQISGEEHSTQREEQGSDPEEGGVFRTSGWAVWLGGGERDGGHEVT